MCCRHPVRYFNQHSFGHRMADTLDGQLRFALKNKSKPKKRKKKYQTVFRLVFKYLGHIYRAVIFALSSQNVLPVGKEEWRKGWYVGGLLGKWADK